MPTFEAGVNTTHAVHNLQFTALRTLGGKRNNRLRRAARNSFSTYSFFLCVTNQNAVKEKWHLSLSDHVTQFNRLYWPGMTTNKPKNKNKATHTRYARHVPSPLCYHTTKLALPREKKWARLCPWITPARACVSFPWNFKHRPAQLNTPIYVHTLILLHEEMPTCGSS